MLNMRQQNGMPPFGAAVVALALAPAILVVLGYIISHLLVGSYRAPPMSFSDCAQIKESFGRLACYDVVAAEVRTPAKGGEVVSPNSKQP